MTGHGGKNCFPCKNDQHRSEIYTCLWLLLTESDKEKFSNCLQLFVKYWQYKEPKFMEYFQGTYGSRSNVWYVLDNYFKCVEKWALAFRHFDHKDTVTQTQITFWKGPMSTRL